MYEMNSNTEKKIATLTLIPVDGASVVILFGVIPEIVVAVSVAVSFPTSMK